eukprot:3612187-Rhodomonas_salina.2
MPRAPRNVAWKGGCWNASVQRGKTGGSDLSATLFVPEVTGARVAWSPASSSSGSSSSIRINISINDTSTASVRDPRLSQRQERNASRKRWRNHPMAGPLSRLRLTMRLEQKDGRTSADLRTSHGRAQGHSSSAQRDTAHGSARQNKDRRASAAERTDPARSVSSVSPLRLPACTTTWRPPASPARSRLISLTRSSAHSLLPSTMESDRHTS